MRDGAAQVGAFQRGSPSLTVSLHFWKLDHSSFQELRGRLGSMRACQQRETLRPGSLVATPQRLAT